MTYALDASVAIAVLGHIDILLLDSFPTFNSLSLFWRLDVVAESGQILDCLAGWAGWGLSSRSKHFSLTILLLLSSLLATTNLDAPASPHLYPGKSLGGWFQLWGWTKLGSTYSRESFSGYGYIWTNCNWHFKWKTKPNRCLPSSYMASPPPPFSNNSASSQELPNFFQKTYVKEVVMLSYMSWMRYDDDALTCQKENENCMD